MESKKPHDTSQFCVGCETGTMDPKHHTCAPVAQPCPCPDTEAHATNRQHVPVAQSEQRLTTEQVEWIFAECPDHGVVLQDGYCTAGQHQVLEPAQPEQPMHYDWCATMRDDMNGPCDCTEVSDTPQHTTTNLTGLDLSGFTGPLSRQFAEALDALVMGALEHATKNERARIKALALRIAENNPQWAAVLRGFVAAIDGGDEEGQGLVEYVFVTLFCLAIILFALWAVRHA